MFRRSASFAVTSRSGLLVAVERRVGVTGAGFAILAVVAAGVAYGRSTANRQVLLMAYGLLLVVIVTWLLGRRRPVIEVSRSEVPGRVRESQAVDVRLALRSRRRLSTLVLEEELPSALGGARRFPLASLPADQEVEHAYTFLPARRGRYQVGPIVAEWSDPFGLTRRRTVLDKPVEVIVHPRIDGVHDRVTSRAWEDPPVRPPVSKPWPTGFEFYGMRDYVSGDDPRRINWRASARTLDVEHGTGRYLVREAEQGITDRVNVYLDTDASAHSPGSPSETFEAGVRTAASLCTRHLKDGFSVDLNTHGSRLAVGQRGRRAELPLLDQLAVVERERVPLSGALDRLLSARGGASHNIVITPELDRSSAMRLRLILDSGVSMLLVLLIWDETEPVTLHRAGSLGCAVAEVRAGDSLEAVFQQAARSRR